MSASCFSNRSIRRERKRSDSSGSVVIALREARIAETLSSDLSRNGGAGN
ncbi:MAG TPA: hypothetical protein VE546_04360 [Streptomyces sp.]|nr:hypothetical protein [Streptomyces sp.]HZG02796.1 hypothetical protein [Streptomyces sp.]